MSCRVQSLIAFTLILLVFGLRIPDLFIHPRFWAEEGMFYYRYAMEHSFWDTLFSIQLGYFSLFANMGAALAGLLPIASAPIATTFLSLLVMLVPHLIIWCGNSELWQSSPKKWLASAVILFVGQHDELWLNSITLQFHAGLIVFLLLLEAKPSRPFIHYLLLGLAGLSGLVACLLAPLYAYRAWRHRSRYHYIMAGILIGVSIFHIAAIVWADEGLSTRMQYFHWQQRITPIFSNGVHMLLLRDSFAINNLHRMIMEHGYGMDLMLYFLLASLLCFIGLIILMLRLHRHEQRLWFVGGFLITLLLTIFLAMSGHAANPRYAYIPTAIAALSLAGGISFHLPLKHITNSIAVMLLAVVVIIHFLGFWGGFYSYHPSWPKWQHEVARWKNGEIDRLAIYPHWKHIPWYIEPVEAPINKQEKGEGA